jgi:ribosomal protein S27AE
MTEDSSGKGSGLFGKKDKGPKDVTLCIINKFDRDIFFQQLKDYGWEEVESAFTFDFNWSEKKIQKAATEHAHEVNGDLLIQVKDRDSARNPFNDFVYYIWRSTPNTRGLPPRPNIGQQQVQQMQMLQQQQVALMQKQMEIQRAMSQQQMQPGQTPTGQVCIRCGSNQIQFMANGTGKCIKCGFTFQWRAQQQMPMQQPMPMQPPPQQMPQQPPPQQQPQAQPQAGQAQMPNVPPPVQPGTPTPPGARTCPKCGSVLNVFPDGSFLCAKCGYTGK